MVECWCCGESYPAEEVAQLGGHPEVAVCGDCARFLLQRIRERHDALHPSWPGRLRDRVRSARILVVRRGWHRNQLIGGALRRLGRHLP